MPEISHLQKTEILESALKVDVDREMQANVKNEFVKPNNKSNFDDTAELFSGLITGDEHFHTRGSAFRPLWA